MTDNADKAPHSEVGYMRGSASQHCGNCANFIAPKGKNQPAHCKGVQDPIASPYWCVRFQPDAA